MEDQNSNQGNEKPVVGLDPERLAQLPPEEQEALKARAAELSAREDVSRIPTDPNAPEPSPLDEQKGFRRVAGRTDFDPENSEQTELDK